MAFENWVAEALAAMWYYVLYRPTSFVFVSAPACVSNCLPLPMRVFCGAVSQFNALAHPNDLFAMDCTNSDFVFTFALLQSLFTYFAATIMVVSIFVFGAITVASALARFSGFLLSPLFSKAKVKIWFAPSPTHTSEVSHDKEKVESAERKRE